MSWDAVLTDDRGHIEGDWNYTHNTSRMIYAAWDDAGIEYDEARSWIDHVNGMSGPEGQRLLKIVADALESDPVRFDGLNPPNGWGDRVTFLGVLRSMVAAVPEWPTTWSVHG
jgi:hypothetical protein